MILRLSLSILLFLPVLCFADSLIIGGISHHSDSKKPERVSISPVKTVTVGGQEYKVGGAHLYEEKTYNEEHPAIGYEKNGHEFTVYKNSFSETSYSYSRIVTNRHGIGARLGAALYEGRGVVPVVQFGYFADNYDITFGYVSTLVLKIPL